MTRVTAGDYRHPYRPLPIALLNRLGGAVPPIGQLGRLDADGLIAAARLQSGLVDFGDEAFREPLGHLVESIEREARLTATGRLITRTRLLGVLQNRLRAQALFASHPAILRSPVAAPVFIVGLQRTGTTMLQRLLAADPGMRALASWEALNPAPLARRPWHRRDPRIDRAVLAEKGLRYLAPDFFAIHPVEAEAPEEEVILLDYTFLSTVAEATLHVPTFAAWLESQDQTPAYRYLKAMLQLLQWQAPGERWILKTPHHLEWIDTLLAVFPDARIIQTHRDPVTTLASFCSMIAHGRGVFSDQLDPHEIGAHWWRKTRRLVDRAMAARDGVTSRGGGGAFLDVSYYDLMADPMIQVQRIYDFIGRPLDQAVRARMEASRRANRQHKHGEHRYRLEDFGLVRDRVEAGFAAYRSAMPSSTSDSPARPFDLDRELAIACDAVRVAAVACAAIAPGPSIEKEDRSPVTIADFTAQALVCAALAEASAITAVVGEERAADVPEALAAQLTERVGAARGVAVDLARVRDWLAVGEAEPADHAWFWTLDPVDGTKGFLRGGQWAVALALVGDGVVQLGILACPRYEGGLLLAARRGGGASTGPLFAAGSRAPIEQRHAPARVCESVEAGHSDHGRALRVAARVGLTEPSLRMDSQVKYGAIARGDAAAYLRLPTSGTYREKIWDHAAGQIIVEEMGGRVSDVHGQPLDFTRGRTLDANRGVIATRADLHAAVLDALAAEGRVMAPVAEATVEIAAPIDLVWRVMTDVPRYPEWNPFVVDIRPVRGDFAVGAAIALTVKWGRGGGASTIEVVDRLDAPAPGNDAVQRALMEYRFVGWLPRLALVRGSRQQALAQAPGGPTTYRTTERFTGLLARGVPLAKVQDGFERHARALKARVESLA